MGDARPSAVRLRADPHRVHVNPSASRQIGVVEHLDVRVTGLPEYDGPTEIIPSMYEQVLATMDTEVHSNIVVGPIPSNYGLVTYDGTVITIS